MHLKGIEKYKRAFVCTAITIGYFRVPQFRSLFLEQVANKSRAQLQVESGDPIYQEPARALKIEDLVYSCLSSVSESKETHKFFDW